MSVTNDSKPDLSPEEKREMLSKLLQQKGSSRNVFPLSFAQSRMWILDRFQPGDPSYNIPMTLRLPGYLDTEALERSFNEIVRRHEVLRTTFEMIDGKPAQVVAPSLDFKLTLIDLRSSPADARETQMNLLALEESRYSFDLSKGPLMRATLVKLADADHILIIVMHHIISDGWSSGILFRELSALYAAFCVGQSSPLPELPIQYADFAQWQVEYLSGEALEQLFAYWRPRLTGVRPVLDLPTDRPRPAIQRRQGAMLTFMLEPRLLDGLTALSNREGATLFMTLLAAFKTLLHRYTGETDIAIGSPIANRTRPELDGLIGFFVNTLVLRTDLSGDPTFRQLIGRVREVALGAYAHQDMPFEKLVEVLDPERNLSINPLFQILFSVLNLNQPDRSARNSNQDSQDVPLNSNGTAKFDITLSMAEVDQGAQGFIEYNTDLFDESTIARLVERYHIMLWGIVADPDQRLSQLPILGEVERSELALDMSGPDLEHTSEQTIVELIAAHAERTPEAVCVISDGIELNYAELNRRANQLAHALRARGVKPETPVGICLERSSDMIVAALGVLKAGGAYVPLEPSDPVSRISFMIKDAGISLILTNEPLGGNLPQSDAQVFYLDRERDDLAQGSAEEPNVRAHADNMACVLYRSSSAGRPEAVVLTHRALCRTDLGLGLQITATDRVAQMSSLSEDAASLEIFGTLAAGACVVSIPSQPPTPPRKLASLMRDHAVTMLFASASTLERLAREFPWALRTVRLPLCIDRPAALKRLCEVLGPGVFERAHAVYGLTEAGGCCLINPLAKMLARAGVVPVGQPANAKLYLLDNNLEPVPQGVIGELYVSAEALARGYHGRPERTASAFVADPFSRTLGARLYRTGDLARRLSDDSLEYSGRRDGRFAVGGLRVEQEEIEATLARFDGVREAAVVVRDTPDLRNSPITAFVVPAEGQVPTADELRRFLKEWLPDAMLPTTFTLIDVLPRTAGGEADKRALARMVEASDPSNNVAPPYVAPRNDIEERLASIWAKTFGAERIGINDSFFRLGGHSLLATQVVARVNDVFQVELPLTRLFELPTIAELSKIIEQLTQMEVRATPQPILRRAREAVTVPSEPEQPK